MKTLNPVEGFINQTVKVYFELCHLAEAAYGMGKNSGAKRSIMLFLGQRGEVRASELAAEFPDPNNLSTWRATLLELSSSGLIEIDAKNASTLSLTAAGKMKVQEIIKFEASLAQSLPSKVSISDLRKVSQTIEQLAEVLKDQRLSQVAAENLSHIKAS